MKTIRFTSTRLQDAGKKGIFKPDAEGYYDFPLGGLNAFNSAGEYYTLQGAEELFNSSAVLMRRMRNGYLKSELGHPKRLAGMTDDAFLERILTIEETNVSAHIKELWLDRDFGRNNPQFRNPNLVAIMGKIRGSGPHGPALELSLNNPSENVGFSIRGLTQNFYDGGRCVRVLTAVVTFDQVVEQGIPLANKWNAPSLEALGTPALASLDMPVNERQLRRLADVKSPVALESTRQQAIEVVKSLDTIKLPSLIINNW